MKALYKISLHALLYLLSATCFAQDLLFNVQFFDQSDGLSDRSVFAVNQDDRGLIWIGTGNGLNQFDGKEFRVIGEQNSRTSTGNVFRVQKDQEGDFWIEKEGESVIHFDPYKEELIPLPDERFNDLKYLLPAINKSDVFFRSKENDVFYLDEQKNLIAFSKTEIPIRSRVNVTSWRTLLIDAAFHKKKIEIDEDGDTLRVFDNQLSFPYDDGKKKLREGVIEVEENKLLNETLFEIKKEGDLVPFEFLIDDRPFSFKDIGLEGPLQYTLRKDKAGNYWFVVRNKVFFFDEHKKLQKEITNDLLDLSGSTWNANDVFVDDDNRIWIASGIGLFLIDVKVNPFQVYLDETGRTSTRGITSNSEDEIFIANYLGAKKLNKVSEEIIEAHDFYGSSIAKIGEDEIWVGTTSGFYILDEKKDSVDNRIIKELGRHDVLSFLVDADAELVYIGTSQGLWISDMEASNIKKDDRLNKYPEFVEAYIPNLLKNADGIWLATRNGLYLFDPDKGIIDHVQFPNNKIKFIHEDKVGDFWMATQGGGLIHWDRKNNIKNQITTNDGLSHNVIYAVYEDEEGYLWLPSNNGLMRFEKETREVNLFQPEDGIAHKEFNTYSHHQAEDGRLYFGGLNGVTAFYPKELISKQNDAPFMVTQLQQFDADEGRLINKTKDFQKTNKITLASFDKFFTIDFSLLDYSGREHIYAWKIKGLDEEWNYQTENSIRINALNYGDFSLQIKAKGAGGQWAEQQLEIPIHVQKPFYLKWPFILGGVFCFGLLVYSYLRLRFLRLRRSREKLRLQVEERTIELSEKNMELEASNQIKDKLFAIIAHDLRGPAFSLQDVGQKLNYLIDSQQTERLKDFGGTVDESVSRLINLLNNLLTWANQNLKTTSLNPEKLNVQKLTKYTLLELQPLADKKNIALEFDVSPALETFSDEQAVLTITRNLLANAIKFTPPEGKILFKAERQNGSVLLSIKDNGVGIEPEKLSRIFNLQGNKSTRGTEGETGTGLGLSVSKELAVLNGGDIAVKSDLEIGTTFILTLPASSS